ncbi:MAG: hypothetical protein P1U74_01810 [Legionellaceae bacterium]|nr:hypothetical protein [Legionellaceae bacterium]
MDSSKNIMQRNIASIVFLLISIYPLFFVVYNGYVLTGLYEESVGYRYFYPLRQLYDSSTYLFLPQGQFLDILNQQIHRILSFFGYSSTQLYPRINYFSYISVFSLHLINSCCFLWAIRPLNSLPLIILSVVYWLFVFFSPNFNGFVVLLQPDYLLMSLALTLIAAGCYLRWPTSNFKWQLSHTLFLGIYFGVALAVKMTFVILPLTICLGWMINEKSFSRSVLYASMSILLGASIYFIILLIHYRRFDFITEYFVDIMSFMKSGGGIAQISWSKWIAIKWHEPFSIHKIIYFTPLVPLIALLKVKNRFEFSAVFSLFIGSLAYHLFIHKRDYPNSMFESLLYTQLVFWLVFCWIYRERLSLKRITGRATAVSIWVIIVVMIAPIFSTSIQTIYPYLKEIGKNTVVQQNLFNAQQNIIGKRLWLVMNNVFRPVSIDSAIMKGCTGREGWQVPESKITSTMFPNVDYRVGGSREFYEKNTIDLAKYNAILFTTYYADLDLAIKENFDFFNLNSNNFDCSSERINLIYQTAIICHRT